MPSQPDTKAEVGPAPEKSPWLSFVTGKKRAAKPFLLRMTKDRISIPDEETRVLFARAVAEKPSRLRRVLELIAAVPSASPTLRDVALDLAGTTMSEFGVQLDLTGMAAASFEGVTDEWLASRPRRPLPKTELEVLALLLHWGRQRAALEADAAYRLVQVATQRKPKAKQHKSKAPFQQGRPADALEVLLAAPFTASALNALVALHGAHQRAVERMRAELQELARRTDELERSLSSADGRAADLEGTIEGLESQKTALESLNADLKRDMIEIEDGYKHKLSDLRGRMRGTLDGSLSRWLETALDASRSEPPWLDVVRERLEDALALIEKEKQWLLPSA